MADFHDVLFPTHISFGASGGPERRIEIVSLTSGREHRNQRFAHSRRRYDVGTGIRSIPDLQQVVAFFEARRGSLHGFRFRDPFDMKSCLPQHAHAAGDQRIGTGNGSASEFQLVKIYGEGADAYHRPIHTPQVGSVMIAINGATLSADIYDVDNLTGLVNLNEPPPSGAVVTAGYVFEVPVRFDVDQLSVGISAFSAGQIPSIPLKEIMP